MDTSMRMAVGTIAAVLPVFAALAQTPEDQWTIRSREYREWFQRTHEKDEQVRVYEIRIAETRPGPRDEPMRYLNIRDEEVREIRAAAQEIFPGEMVYIAAVVTGCPCEDGPGCKDQVWAMTYNPKATFNGILMSRIDERWQIGPVQRWWIERAHLAGRRKSFASTYDFMAAESALTLRFPACPAEIERLMEYRQKPFAGPAAKTTAPESPSRSSPPSSQTPRYAPQ